MSSDVALPPLNGITPPTPPFATSDRPISRPLSEISDNSNSDKRRSTARSLKGDKGEKRSRPNSEVADIDNINKRLSASTPLQTITVNLVDYATVVSKSPVSVITALNSAPPPPSPTTKPLIVRMDKPAGSVSRPLSLNSVSRPVSAGSIRDPAGRGDEASKEAQTKDTEESSSKDGVSALFMSKRASLRPSPLGATYADVVKPIPSPTLSITSQSSFDSAASSSENASKPTTKPKPSWLRRASGTAALRSKTRSPAPKDEEGSLTASTSLPPMLPPRKGGMLASTAELVPDETETESRRSMLPPDIPSRTSYATVAAAGPSRSRLGDGQGRPAFSPTGAPPLPSRDNVGNIRGRLAAWTAATQSTSSFSRSLSRSDSSTSIASTSAPSPSNFVQTAQQRVPSSAQRVLGHAGSAVQKGWAGIRSRGVGGSISGMSSLNPSGRRGSMEPSGSRASGLARGGSRDRTQSADYDPRSGASDGPVFQEGVILRAGGERVGRVFGRDLVDVGRTWGVVEATLSEEKESDWQKRRKQCLPALVVRTVDYLEVWGPKEEGVFRISGRSSHIARLRKEFDAGADLDLQMCHPGDLDPHAVSGIFKSYLRELPSPLLTNGLSPKFEAYVRARRKGSLPADEADVSSPPSTEDRQAELNDLPSLLKQLPSAHWFLLADVVKLLDLIPRHHQVNRMTLNAIMLSLGPSLNIPGGVLTELLEKRETLFATPPALTAAESASSIINFGNADISPPHLPKELEQEKPALASPISADLAHDATKKARVSPRLLNKPSITRLFSSSSAPGRSSSKKSSNESMRSSKVDLTPPRVDLRSATPSRLSFMVAQEDDSEQLVAPINENDAIYADGVKPGDLSIPAGTVEERSRAFSTPIADMYQSTAPSFPSLRSQTSSLSIGASSQALPTLMSESQIPQLAASVPSTPAANPASVIRRGPSVFFSSASLNERSNRSPSGTSIAPSPKRKEDSPTLSTPRSSTEGIDTVRGKRLSASPGSMNVRDVVRTVEMTA